MDTMQKYDLRTLYYHVTNRCNLACRHCWVRAGASVDGEEITLQESTGILKDCKKLGLRHVKLTGGEPFLIPWVLGFIQQAAELDVTVGIETNGTLVTPEIAESLKKSGNITHISVSIDGATEEAHESLRCVKGCFEKAVTGIKTLMVAGIQAGLVASLHKGNIGQVVEIGKLAASMGVKDVKLNSITSAGRGGEMADERLDWDDEMAVVEQLEAMGREAGVFFRMDLPLCAVPLQSMKHHCPGCDIRHVLGLLSNGDFAMCGVGLTMPEMVYGNFRTCDVAEIWSTNPRVLELRAGLPNQLEGACRDCVLKESCRGGCRAMAYLETGTLMGPGLRCQLAKDRGLIPPTRVVEHV